MSVKFTTTTGNKKVFGKIENIEDLTRQGIRAGMFEVGEQLIKRANTDILKGTKTGRVYFIKTKSGRKRHKSSAPGETHADLTGAARRSLGVKLRGTRSIEFGYGVSAGEKAPEYVRWLEFGSKRMKPRPTLHNALKSEQSNIVRHFENGIKEQLK